MGDDRRHVVVLGGEIGVGPEQDGDPRIELQADGGVRSLGDRIDLPRKRQREGRGDSHPTRCTHGERSAHRWRHQQGFRCLHDVGAQVRNLVRYHFEGPPVGVEHGHDAPGPGICRAGDRSVTEIRTPSGHSRRTEAEATNGRRSTRAAVAPGLTSIMAGCPSSPAAARMALSLVWGCPPVTVTTRAANSGVWRRARPPTTTTATTTAATTHRSRLRPWLRRTDARRCRMRGSMERLATPVLPLEGVTVGHRRLTGSPPCGSRCAA